VEQEVARGVDGWCCERCSDHGDKNCAGTRWEVGKQSLKSIISIFGSLRQRSTTQVSGLLIVKFPGDLYSLVEFSRSFPFSTKERQIAGQMASPNVIEIASRWLPPISESYTRFKLENLGLLLCSLCHTTTLFPTTQRKNKKVGIRPNAIRCHSDHVERPSLFKENPN